MIEADGKAVHVQSETISQAELTACATISGECSDAPLGIAFVFALRTVIGSGLLPDGAMMLGHRVTWHGPPHPGAFVTEMSFAAADPPRTRFQRVVIAYKTHEESREGRLLAEQEQEVLWPITA